MEDFSRLPHPHASRSQISLVKQEEKGGREEEDGGGAPREGRRSKKQEVKGIEFLNSVGAAGNRPTVRIPQESTLETERGENAKRAVIE